MPPLPIASYPADAAVPTDVVAYGPDIPDESSLRLLGPLDGRRVLLLGCARGHTSVALASQGAHVIVVDTDLETDPTWQRDWMPRWWCG